MANIFRAAAIIFGAVFLLIGVAGLFHPAAAAAQFGLAYADGEGAGSVRALIGAHYAAMGGVCIFAALRQKPILLLPIGVIEAVMVIARGIAAVNGEFTEAAAIPTLVELAAAGVLLTASTRNSSTK